MQNGCSSPQFSYKFGQQKCEALLNVINCFCFSFKAVLTPIQLSFTNKDFKKRTNYEINQIHQSFYNNECL